MSNLPTETPPARDAEAASPAPGVHARKRKYRLIFWTVIVVGLAGIVYVGYRSHTNRTPSAFGGGRGRGGFGGFGMNTPLPVVVQAAQKGNINVILDGLGTVTPLATVTVRTQISGYLTQVNFTEGQMVSKGDVLAVIDPRPYQVALEQAQGQLIQAQAQLSEAKIDLDRYVTLSSQDSISKQQVDAQRALVQQYEGLTKTDQGAVDSAQLNLAYCHIVAPVSGRVGLRLVDAGNYVTPGDSTGIVILTQLQPITVIFVLPEDNIPAVQARIKAGATIGVVAYDRTHTTKLAKGVVTNIDNEVDTTTGTFKLRATFPNDDEALFPSQFVNIEMLLDVDRGVTVIPTSAIERGQQGTFVYVVGADNKVAAVTVTLGDQEGERVAVTSGISLGDRVVVDGADRLKDGMEVVVQNSSDATGTHRARAGGGEHRHGNWSGSN